MYGTVPGNNNKIVAPGEYCPRHYFIAFYEMITAVFDTDYPGERISTEQF
jgi:hypothetical protein